MDQPYTIQQPTARTSYQFVLESYMIHSKTLICLHCQACFETVALWEVHVNPSLTGRTAARQLHPTKTIRPGFPIGHSKLANDSVPCCHRCYQTFLPMTTASVDPSEWAKTLQKKYAPYGVLSMAEKEDLERQSTVTRPKAAPARRPFTIDDL